MPKGVFKLSTRATEGFIDYLIRLMDVPLAVPDYTYISKRVKTVVVKYRNPCKSAVTHFFVNSTGLKVFGEG